VGGICQLLAGIGEYFVGNTFGATAFTSYGGFWIAWAVCVLITLMIIFANSLLIVDSNSWKRVRSLLGRISCRLLTS